MAPRDRFWEPNQEADVQTLPDKHVSKQILAGTEQGLRGPRVGVLLEGQRGHSDETIAGQKEVRTPPRRRPAVGSKCEGQSPDPHALDTLMQNPACLGPGGSQKGSCGSNTGRKGGRLPGLNLRIPALAWTGEVGRTLTETVGRWSAWAWLQGLPVGQVTRSTYLQFPLRPRGGEPGAAEGGREASAHLADGWQVSQVRWLFQVADNKKKRRGPVSDT